jgi:hypothetical protein
MSYGRYKIRGDVALHLSGAVLAAGLTARLEIFDPVKEDFYSTPSSFTGHPVPRETESVSDI